jgi:hypothetical protein
VVQFCYLITQIFVSEAIKAGSDTMNRELWRTVITNICQPQGESQPTSINGPELIFSVPARSFTNLDKDQVNITQTLRTRNCWLG